MTSLRLVQAGTGPSRPAVFLFLVGSHMDADLIAALGPVPCIVADDGAHGTETIAELLAFARAKGGFSENPWFALCGYSMGVQRVRTLLRAGATPAAVIAIDGTHASKPPESWQIDVWKNLCADARAGRVTFAATHTLQTYTELLKPPDTPFICTVNVLRMATGWPLDGAGPIDAPGETQAGDLHVYSYQSKTIDGPAHIAQQRIALPFVLKRHVKPLVDEERGQQPPPVPRPVDETLTLGERALVVARAELATGEKEVPGPKSNPRIVAYLAGCERSGHKLGLASDEIAWCAAFASWCAFEAAKDGGNVPHGYRAAVAELWADAKIKGCTRLKGYRPIPGDLAIWKRAGADPSKGGQGHVGRVAAVYGYGFDAIEGNHLDQIAEVEHSLDGDDLIGFITYP